MAGSSRERNWPLLSGMWKGTDSFVLRVCYATPWCCMCRSSKRPSPSLVGSYRMTGSFDGWKSDMTKLEIKWGDPINCTVASVFSGFWLAKTLLLCKKGLAQYRWLMFWWCVLITLPLKSQFCFQNSSCPDIHLTSFLKLSLFHQ